MNSKIVPKLYHIIYEHLKEHITWPARGQLILDSYVAEHPFNRKDISLLKYRLVMEKQYIDPNEALVDLDINTPETSEKGITPTDYAERKGRDEIDRDTR